MSQEKSTAMTNAVKLVKIMVYVQNKKNSKTNNKFKTYRTKMNLEVIENGESKGKENRYVDVKFTNEVKEQFKGKLNRGYYFVPANELSAPKKYEIIEKDGKLIYPEVWIRKIDHIDEKPFVPEFDSFVTDEEPTEEVDMDEQPEIVGESLPFDEE